MLTISKMRKDLFRLAKLAAEGKNVEFVHKGQMFRLVPKVKPNKLSRLTPWETAGVGESQDDFVKATQQMSQQILEDWDRKWAKK